LAPVRLATDYERRNTWFVRLTKPAELLQPSPLTGFDRYPEIFEFVRGCIGQQPGLRLLSFGCSTGEEAFSLLHYLPAATVRGLDINRLSVWTSIRRARAAHQPRPSFAVAGSARAEPDDHYDAVFAMAVFRHGGLSYSDEVSCDRWMKFEAFERGVAELARCLKPGGLLAIQHSNFRFCDTETARFFDPVFRLPGGNFHPQAPLFGPDNLRLPVEGYGDVVFQKRMSDTAE
jgi:SAM-dependent methyltransferase